MHPDSRSMRCPSRGERRFVETRGNYRFVTEREGQESRPCAVDRGSVNPQSGAQGEKGKSNWRQKSSDVSSSPNPSNELASTTRIHRVHRFSLVDSHVFL